MDSCDAQIGCSHTLGADATCGVVNLPYSNTFTCSDTSLNFWQRSGTDAGADAVRWDFDATAAVPGAYSPPCSLNVNNGKELTCAVGQAAILATADSPWIDAATVPANAPMRIRFYSAGSWAATQKATVLVRVFGGEWSEIATVAPGGSWQQIKVESTAWSGKKFQVRFSFTGACSISNNVGWFVDDFDVSEDKCAVANGGCPDGTLCSVTATGAVICTPCPNGYKLVAGACADIDECALPATCAANAMCSNTPGSYSCACKAGFTGDGKTCTDVDECAATPFPCSPLATCANQPGTYTCTCAGGTTGNGKVCGKKGTQANPGATCAEILALYPGSADGNYWLDPDGSGPAGAGQYYCDMKNGGWILLIWDDFEDSTTKGWSGGIVTKCGKYGKILGGYNVFGGGASTAKAISIIPQHSEYKLSMNYIYIDTWDKEWASVRIDGGEVWSHQHDGNGWGANQCGAWWSPEDKGDVGVQKAHTAGSITVSVTSTLNEKADNESFAIDNVALWVR